MRLLLKSLRLLAYVVAETVASALGIVVGVAAGLLHMARYAVIGVLGLCTSLGMWAIADAFRAPKLPPIKPAVRWIELPPHVFQDRAALLWMSDQQRWSELSNALLILDTVCPDVSAWTRDRWDTGHLEFETAAGPYWARWKPWPFARVSITLCLLECGSDAYIAQVLAHEFRHSRQPTLPAIQCGIAAMCGLDRKDLVESEAEEFEARVARAIRGER